jgi:membrane associated rhomboid family serine protease
MAEVPTISAPGAPAPLQLDVCSRCDLVWFDPREHETWLKAPSSAAATENLSAETQRALDARGVTARIALSDAARMGPPAADDSLIRRAEDSLGEKQLLCLLGLPVEVEPPPLRSTPWATWTLAVFIVAVSVCAFVRLDAAANALGFEPAEMWRRGGLTFVTSFLLHGSLWHLLGNLYYLLVFGDDVEDRLGAGWYLMLIALSSLTGDLLHAAVNPDSTVPAIGASGGIAGLLAFYALRFPHRTLRISLYGNFFDVRVSAAIVAWVLLQLVGAAQATMMPDGKLEGGVAYLAHLGGAAVGVVFWGWDAHGEGDWLWPVPGVATAGVLAIILVGSHVSDRVRLAPWSPPAGRVRPPERDAPPVPVPPTIAPATSPPWPAPTMRPAAAVEPETTIPTIPPSPAAATPGPASFVDIARAQGARAFEASVAQIVRRADALQSAIREHQIRCDAPPDRPTRAACELGLQALAPEVARLARALDDADEAARHAWVQPGTRRQILERSQVDDKISQLRRLVGAADAARP